MEKPLIPQKSPIIIECEPGNYSWCSCGKSEKQPYCDGSHKGSSFSPIRMVIDESRRVAWCACKQTKNPPFCDGSHKHC